MPIVEESQVYGYLKSLSNWDRWGAADQLGTLNLITDASRVRAAQLVTGGHVLSLGTDMDPAKADPLGRGSVLQRYMMLYSGEESSEGYDDLGELFGVREFIGMIPHGSLSHVDSPAHNGYKGSYYNGFPTAATTTTVGARNLDVANAREGIVTRGLLFDIPALKGKPWLDPGEHVFPEDLLAAEERQGIEAGEGDVLLLHTGTEVRIAEQGAAGDGATPGLSASCLPWLHQRGIALLGSDSLNDVSPSGYESNELVVPIHLVGLVAMGLWLADNLHLESLAAACAERSRWSFLLTMAPLRLVGSTSSPINPLAVF